MEWKGACYGLFALSRWMLVSTTPPAVLSISDAKLLLEVDHESLVTTTRVRRWNSCQLLRRQPTRRSMFSAQSSGAVSFSCLVANTFLESEGDRSPSLGCASQVIYLCFRTELVHPSPTFFSPFFLTAAHKYIIPAHYSYSISMGIILFICVLFTLMVPSFFATVQYTF